MLVASYADRRVLRDAQEPMLQFFTNYDDDQSQPSLRNVSLLPHLRLSPEFCLVEPSTLALSGLSRVFAFDLDTYEIDLSLNKWDINFTKPSQSGSRPRLEVFPENRCQMAGWSDSLLVVLRMNGCSFYSMSEAQGPEEPGRRFLGSIEYADLIRNSVFVPECGSVFATNIRGPERIERYDCRVGTLLSSSERVGVAHCALCCFPDREILPLAGDAAYIRVFNYDCEVVARSADLPKGGSIYSIGVDQKRGEFYCPHHGRRSAYVSAWDIRQLQKPFRCDDIPISGYFHDITRVGMDLWAVGCGNAGKICFWSPSRGRSFPSSAWQNRILSGSDESETGRHGKMMFISRTRSGIPEWEQEEKSVDIMHLLEERLEFVFDSSWCRLSKVLIRVGETRELRSFGCFFVEGVGS